MLWFWLGLAVAFVVLLVLMWKVARRVDDIEDDTRYVTDDQPMTPYGQKFTDILRGRGNDD